MIEVHANYMLTAPKNFLLVLLGSSLFHISNSVPDKKDTADVRMTQRVKISEDGSHTIERERRVFVKSPSHRRDPIERMIHRISDKAQTNGSNIGDYEEFVPVIMDSAAHLASSRSYSPPRRNEHHHRHHSGNRRYPGRRYYPTHSGANFSRNGHHNMHMSRERPVIGKYLRKRALSNSSGGLTDSSDDMKSKRNRHKNQRRMRSKKYASRRMNRSTLHQMHVRPKKHRTHCRHLSIDNFTDTSVYAHNVRCGNRKNHLSRRSYADSSSKSTQNRQRSRRHRQHC